MPGGGSRACVGDVFWTREGEFTSGNVNNRVDLAEHTGAYGPQVTLSLRPLDAAPLDALNAVEWLLDTNANGGYDHYVSWVPPMGVADPPWFVKVFRNATPNDVLQCEVPLTFDGTFYRASFAPSCLGSPAQVGVVARFWGDSPEPTGLNVDVAPDTGFSGPVPRPAGAADALRAEGVAPAPVERRLPSAGTPPAAPEERARP